MYELQFLCLAASRRDGGSCIAGIDLASRKWIRPVNAGTQGAFADHELIVLEAGTQKRRFIAPLDVLHLTLDGPAGEKGQPENWTMKTKSFDDPNIVIRRLNGREIIGELRDCLDHSDRLLHTYTDSLTESEVKSRPLTHSLALIEPDRLHWRMNENRKFSNSLQVRADFLFAQTPYSLVVTDPNWEARCRPLGLGMHPHSTLESVAGEQVLLTVSLAGIPLHGYHYKLVAAVIILPR
jgi:hypothetical protein